MVRIVGTTIPAGRSDVEKPSNTGNLEIVCPRLGLNEEETRTVEWLVLNHLLMSKTAFRYELGDPKTIKDFSNKVVTVERLKLLLVLTVDD